MDNQGEKDKVAKKRYRQSEKGRIAHCLRSKKHRQTEKGKASQRAGQKRFHAHYPNYLKAKNAVNHSIRNDKLSRPDSLLCYYCPVQAKEYHHWHGYEPEHWLDVVPVCLKCHQKCKKKIA